MRGLFSFRQIWHLHWFLSGILRGRSDSFDGMAHDLAPDRPIGRGLDRTIIGPSAATFETEHTLMNSLCGIGVADAKDQVVVCDILLR